MLTAIQLLFLDRDKAEKLDPRDERTSSIRLQFKNLVNTHMQGQATPSHQQSPPLNGRQSPDGSPQPSQPIPPTLPPLSFDPSMSSQPQHVSPVERERRALTPITERSIPMTEFDTRSLLEPHGSMSRRSIVEGSLNGRMSTQGMPETVTETPEDGSALGGMGGMTYGSPSPIAESNMGSRERSPQDSGFLPPAQRRSQDYFSNGGMPLPPLKTLSEEPERQTSPVDPSKIELPRSPEVPQLPQIPMALPRSPSPSVSMLTSPHSPTGDGPHPSFNSLLPLPYDNRHADPQTPTTVASLPLPYSPEPSKSATTTPAPDTPVVALASVFNSSLSSSRASHNASVVSKTSSARDDDVTDLTSEPGALYWMQQQHKPSAPRSAPLPPPSDDTEDETDESDRPLARTTSPLKPNKPISPPRSPEHKGAPMGFEHLIRNRESIAPLDTSRARSISPQKEPSPPYGTQRGAPVGLAHLRHTNGSTSSVGHGTSDAETRSTSNHNRVTLAHRPSGARAPPASRSRLLPNPGQPSSSSAAPAPVNAASAPAPAQLPPPRTSRFQRPETDQSSMSSYNDTMAARQPTQQPGRRSYEDDDVAGAADAMAVLSYLDNASDDDKPTQLPPSISARSARSPPPASPSSPTLPKTHEQSRLEAPTEGGQYRSSFAPSKQAAERRAKSQAQQAAQQAAATKPGRANGARGKAPARNQAWGESSDEEEEDEDEDEEVDSDAEPKKAKPQMPPSAVRPLSPRGRGQSPGMRRPSPGGLGSQGVSPAGSTSDLGHGPVRPPRNLPQVPSGLGDNYGA